MTFSHVWSLPEQHLLPDAIVAYVDGELGSVARGRVEQHLGQCPSCAAETAAQQQVRGTVRSAAAPQVPAGLLASLRTIPTDTELPPAPDGLAVSADGQLVMVQRPEKAREGSAAESSHEPRRHVGDARPLGSSRPLGAGVLAAPSAMLDEHTHRSGRRAAQGAGVVVSGLVLGALVMTLPSVQAPTGPQPPRPPAGSGASAAPTRGPATPNVARAAFNGVRSQDARGGRAAATTTAAATTSTAPSVVDLRPGRVGR